MKSLYSYSFENILLKLLRFNLFNNLYPLFYVERSEKIEKIIICKASIFYRIRYQYQLLS